MTKGAFQGHAGLEMSTYAVTWRDQAGAVHAGRLELGRTGLRLEAGRHRGGRVSVLRMFYRDVLHAQMAPSAKSVGDRPTIALTGSNGSVYIAPAGPGFAREVLGLVQLGGLDSAQG
jgi:hypothetical protein